MHQTKTNYQRCLSKLPAEKSQKYFGVNDEAKCLFCIPVHLLDDEHLYTHVSFCQRNEFYMTSEIVSPMLVAARGAPVWRKVLKLKLPGFRLKQLLRERAKKLKLQNGTVAAVPRLKQRACSGHR